ncbi:MAG TPA: hypothetical protein VLV83_11025 [Acidobacteriota bacterium]|nr:hypothetical protein [Acidobacteriota bacterium]
MRPRMSAHLICLGATATVLCAGLLAQGNSPNWIEDSPPGGEVSQLALDGGNPNRIYAAAGHLYISRNRGTTWALAEVPRRGIVSVVAAPSLPGTFYIVESSALLRGQGGGATLSAVESTRSFSSTRLLAVDPTDSDRLYLEDRSKPSVERSDDGGRSWQDISPVPEFRLSGFALHPNQPEWLLACDDNNIWRSEDGGATWTRVLFSASEDDPFDALAFTSEGGALAAGRELWISSDEGRSWERLQSPVEEDIEELAVAPSQPSRVFASTALRVLRSDDGGRTWEERARGLEHRRVTDLAADPRDSSVVHAGTFSGGVFITRNGGEHWHLNSEGLCAVANHVIELESGALLAATQGGIFLRRPGDPRWTRRGRIEGAARAYDLAPTAIGIYAASSRGLLFSADQGESWQRLEHPALDVGCAHIDARADNLGEPEERGVIFCITNRPPVNLLRIEHRQSEVSVRSIEEVFLGYRDVAIDPFRPRTIYVAEFTFGMFATRFGSLAVSTDDGMTWNRSNPGDRGEGVIGLALSPHHEGRLLAFQENNVYISNDRGQTFGTSTLPGPRGVESAVIDPSDRRTFYVASGVELFVSRDWGGTLRRLSASPPPALFRSLTFGTTQPPSLLAATRSGVFRLPLEEGVRRVPLAFGGARVQPASNGQLVLYNTSAESPVTADILFINEEGREARQDIYIPPRGLRTSTTVSGFTSGWAEVQPRGGEDDPSQTPLRFFNFLTAGSGVAATDGDNLLRSFYLPVLDGKIAGASTLLAMANPGLEPRSVRLELRNPDSGRRAQADVEISARGQLLLEPSEIEWRFSSGLETDFRTFVGYLEGHATPSPILVAGLLRIGQDLSVLAPARPTPPQGFRTEPKADSQLLFAQFGHGESNGALLRARLALFNPAPVSVSVEIDFIARDGTPLPTALNEDSPGGRTQATVTANALTLLEAPMPPPGRLDFGWMRLNSSYPLQAWLILTGNLGTATLTGRPPAESPAETSPEAPAHESFLPVLNAVAPFRSTGLAVANPSEEDVIATLRLYNANGLHIATANLDLPAGSQRGAFLPEIDFQPEANSVLPPLDDFQGLLAVSSPIALTTSLIHLRPGHFALLPLP